MKKLDSWKAYYTEIMLLITYIAALVTDKDLSWTIILSIGYVVFRALLDISHDIDKRYGPCKALSIICFVLIVLAFILVFAVWISGVWGIIEIIHAITKG